MENRIINFICLCDGMKIFALTTHFFQQEIAFETKKKAQKNQQKSINCIDKNLVKHSSTLNELSVFFL
jgi:hypothetical protein